MARIRYTKHAIERLIERNITKKLIDECIKKPDNITHDKHCNTILQKLINNKLLRVITKRENNDIIVITAYITSKTQKYLKKTP